MYQYLHEYACGTRRLHSLPRYLHDLQNRIIKMAIGVLSHMSSKPTLKFISGDEETAEKGPGSFDKSHSAESLNFTRIIMA